MYPYFMLPRIGRCCRRGILLLLLLLLYTLPAVHVQVWIYVACTVRGGVVPPGTSPGPLTNSASAVHALQHCSRRSVVLKLLNTLLLLMSPFTTAAALALLAVPALFTHGTCCVFMYTPY